MTLHFFPATARHLGWILAFGLLPSCLFAAEVVDRLRVNGMELSIRAFTLPGNVESIAKAWLLRVPVDSTTTVHTHAEGERVIIGRLIGGTSETVTIRRSRDSGHADVVIARYNLRIGLRRPPLPPVVLPSSHTVTNVIEWPDGDPMTFYQIHSRLVPAESSRVLEERLRAGGWIPDALKSRGSMASAEGAWWVKRGAERLAIGVIASKHGGSRVVMQWRRPDAEE